MTPDPSHGLLVPAVFLPKIRQAADEERRTPSDLVGDALRLYIAEQELNQLFAYGQARAQALGLSEDDVPRLIAEHRTDDGAGHTAG